MYRRGRLAELHPADNSGDAKFPHKCTNNDTRARFVYAKESLPPFSTINSASNLPLPSWVPPGASLDLLGMPGHFQRGSWCPLVLLLGCILGRPGASCVTRPGMALALPVATTSLE